MHNQLEYPSEYAAIMADSERLGFTLMCEPKTGALLRTLAAAKPKGQILEIGTGTGLSTAWILDGISDDSFLTSIEQDHKCIEVARRHLGYRKNLELVCVDATEYILNTRQNYDFIFADTFPGKFTLRDEVLNLLKPGGFYVIDDLLPQVTWPSDGHAAKVAELIDDLGQRPDLKAVQLQWASGLMVCVKTIL